MTKREYRKFLRERGVPKISKYPLGIKKKKQSRYYGLVMRHDCGFTTSLSRKIKNLCLIFNLKRLS